MAVTQSATNILILGAAGDAVARDMYVDKIVWAGNTAAADDLKVSNGDSSLTIVETVAGSSGCNFTLDFSEHKRGRYFAGIKASVMDTGKLFVYKR